MKVIVNIILIISLIGHCAAFAHEGHNDITEETALNIVNKSVKQHTFKDFGYEVGKLDASWKSVTRHNLKTVKKVDKSFIISAANIISDTVIYFHIEKNGKIRAVTNDVINP